MFDKYLTKTGRLSCKLPQDLKNLWYILKFQEVHGDRYDYSQVDYKTTKEKVVIICKEHGCFFQTPDNHIKGHGCPDCYGNKKKDTKQCVEDFKLVHGDTYDYSNVNYSNNKLKVVIICKKHGEFAQTPNHHLMGIGCPKCYGNKRKDTEQCIEDFKKVHENTYDYSKVRYSNNKCKVEIICREHGSFFQTPNDHLDGKGCPKCSNHNQDTLYILRCLGTGLVKIGITNNLKQRISSIGGSLEYLYHTNCSNPRLLEKSLHLEYKDFQVFNPTVKSGGTEFFLLTEAHLEEIKQFMSSVQANYLL